jgi:hypothetical protein
MARHLFEYVVYDLDRQEIVDFRLKPWADQFLVLRTALYANDHRYDKDNDDRGMTLTRLGIPFVPIALLDVTLDPLWSFWLAS